jgi:hypothetical protein
MADTDIRASAVSAMFSRLTLGFVKVKREANNG